MKKLLAVTFFLLHLSLSGQISLEKIDSIMLKAIQNRAFNGIILLAKDGNILFEKNHGFANFERGIRFDENTQFQIASVSKQFTAFGIMVLKKEGKLAYDDYVSKYIEGFPYLHITLRQLMQHTSGLPDFWNDIRPNLDTTVSNGNKEMLSYLIKNKLPLRFESGEKWEYSDIGYDILACIIEKVSGQTYQSFMHKKVFKPAGMKNTKALMVTDIRRINSKNLARGYIQDSLKGNQLAHEIKKFVFYLGDFYGDGSVISTPRDMKKWDDALNKYLLLDSSHIIETYKPIIRKDGTIYEMRQGISYGMGWGLTTAPALGRFYYHTGGHPGFVTNYSRYLDKKIVLIVCQNVENNSAFSPYLRKIREILPEIK